MDSITFESESQIYSAKLNLFDSYINRAWQRFNWFITIMFAWISIILSNYEKIQNHQKIIILWSLSGFILSLVWVIIGYEDDKSIQKYGKQIKKFEKNLLSKIDKTYLDLNNNQGKKKNIRQTGWLFWIPLFFIIGWISITLWIITQKPI